MTKEHIPAELRRLVTARAQERCEYCKLPQKFSPQTLSIDHIKPRKLDGETIPENLALCCQGCNSHKSARIVALDPLTSQQANLFNPRVEQWSGHFAWNDDFTQMIGLTPTGRATIEALMLNRDGLINLRRVLFADGEHPPLES